ncbi:dTDP-4-dehydrorhamnose 3,5-epimerase family protein [Hasllibacter sp. MH4015]|uniref:dTDP-4-dehydrorhamnose 3,5-epimerase family protein n=1 Tax=Hasllibacter sp. MH4015 TaxID=2854029 RepID=UPI001CD641E7|nr:dTDP-4-dehydrorhamnose 3,5-epimerase family protein [Hasllibacter sp. MH4015]
MNVTPLPLSGAFEITLERREDARGYFARTYCDDEFRKAGLNSSWPQMNVSMNLAQGTLRGMHFQRAPQAEVKLVRCLRGRAWDVIVDLRAGSASFGQTTALMLDAEALNAVYIPEGFAHGFQAVLPETLLQYMHSETYAPGHEGGISPFDAALSIDWPLPPARMSPRDEALPALAEITPL